MNHSSIDLKASSLLVVDDNPDSLSLLTEMLKRHGFRVRPIPDGKSVLEAVISEPPDLILLDISMPEMNGYEVCEQLKAHEHFSEIPVIFISGLNNPMDKVKAFSFGGIDYITKPFNFEELEARITMQLELCQQRQLLRERYEQLTQLEKLRDNLVHMMIHDMRSPLGGIYGFLELLEMTDGENLSVNGRKYLKTVMDSLMTLMEMANSILDVSRMESGEIQMNQTMCDLLEIVNKVIVKVESLKGTRQILLEAPDEPAFIMADSQLIFRVIQNLLDNAIRFTPKDGQIFLKILSDDAVTRVVVEDTGRGIPLKYLNRVFEKFGQVPELQDNARYSTGLGLTFCKLAIEAHGGNIGVNSTEGKGSSFWFELPNRL